MMSEKEETAAASTAAAAADAHAKMAEAEDEQHEQQQQQQEEEEEEGPREAEAGKRNKKKKRIKGKVRRLIEPLKFYFSDANLRRDRFIRDYIKNDPDNYFPIKLFLKFNKVKSVTSRIQDVMHAIEHIDTLELSPDRQRVRRKDPVIKEKDVDACTIYVEKLPEAFEHDDINALFSRFGTIEYISLPRWPNRKHKGFAFIEFATPLEASACRAHYAHQDVPAVPMAARCWKGPPVDPATLQAETQQQQQVLHNDGGDGDDDDTHVHQQHQQQQTQQESTGGDGGGGGGAMITPGDPGEDFRVLLKSEWLNLKREYKALQRRMLSSIKFAHRRHDNYDGYRDHDDHGQHQQHEEEEEAVTPPTAATTTMTGATAPSMAAAATSAVVEGETAFDPSTIVKGVVLRLTHIPLGVTKQQLKEHLQRRTVDDAGEGQAIEYVDFTLGDTEGHVRMRDSSTAQRVRKATCPPDDDDLWGTMKIDALKGPAEVAYWKHIHESKLQRKQKQKQKKAKRGKSKWLAAEASAPRVAATTRDTPLSKLAAQRIHITFDDEEEEDRGGGRGEGDVQQQQQEEEEEGPAAMQQQQQQQRTEAVGPSQADIEEALRGEEETRVMADAATHTTPRPQRKRERRKRRSSAGAGRIGGGGGDVWASEGESGADGKKQHGKKTKKGKKKPKDKSRRSMHKEGKNDDGGDGNDTAGGTADEADDDKKRQERRRRRKSGGRKSRGKVVAAAAEGVEGGAGAGGDDDDDGERPRKRAKKQGE
ncbi:hypothetical protein PTSG_08541 [Salpingoeca rosetta]|uniref:La-related protein 7 n=1 Tax=Salpingoeca rosetta (strain ATCC 50818 / BSB-021) TaxID=946362 RepID=F2UJZ6_SALR5|nr:uncharacterized protein PTSG_08541 [Salpingoeca rosetta]EGD77445.1 hypothetical protein PTSG_08541 [Salpingoeca rosetta]|eukprot:XP_004990333.1 hypothetical protein PTSG_08541 [Salpingoeca rosetta]